LLELNTLSKLCFDGSGNRWDFGKFDNSRNDGIFDRGDVNFCRLTDKFVGWGDVNLRRLTDKFLDCGDVNVCLEIDDFLGWGVVTVCRESDNFLGWGDVNVECIMSEFNSVEYFFPLRIK